MIVQSVPDYRTAFESVKERYPTPVRSGPWEVKHFTVSEADAKFARLRAAINPHRPYRVVPGGEYVGLWHDQRGPIMTATPDEMHDHYEPYHQASRAGVGTTVLLGGLGLGMVLHGLLQLPNVHHVQVIEIDRDVISLTQGAFAPQIQSGRVSITYGDVFTFPWPKDRHWNVLWIDIWDSLCVDNLTEMTALKRRYGRRADWKGFLGEEVLRRMRHR